MNNLELVRTLVGDGLDIHPYGGESTEEKIDKFISDIESKYPKDVIFDLSNDYEFKQARKVRTERNKKTKKINEARISFTNELKTYSDQIIARLESAYSPIVGAFEKEDAKRKEEKQRIENERLERENKVKDQVAHISRLVTSCKGKSVSEISSAIDAVSNIEPPTYTLGIGDAVISLVAAKEQAESDLTEMLIDAKDRERFAKEQKELEEKEAKAKAERDAFEAEKKAFEDEKKAHEKRLADKIKIDELEENKTSISESGLIHGVDECSVDKPQPSANPPLINPFDCDDITISINIPHNLIDGVIEFCERNEVSEDELKKLLLLINNYF